MLKTVLLSSGYPPSAIEAIQKHWHVINIPDQAETLAYLQSATELPDAICIGYVVSGQIRLPFARAMLAEIQKIDPRIPVIISTGQSAAEAIVDLVKRGAFDYVIEPMDKIDPPTLEAYTQELILALTRAIQWHSLVQENQQLRNQQAIQSLPGAVQLRSPAMLEVAHLIQKVAPTTATVLVTGPSGTGKEVIAQTIHQRSSHSDQPFTAINCGALSQTLLTSELFGHVKGAFTGADHDRQGILQQAGHGTLFLDEIGTVTPAFQVMLLRILEQRVARPVGSQKEYPVHCRFIAAANQDLAQKVREGHFREDFYYRLNLFHIHLPPSANDPVISPHSSTTLSAKQQRTTTNISQGSTQPP